MLYEMIVVLLNTIQCIKVQAEHTTFVRVCLGGLNFWTIYFSLKKDQIQRKKSSENMKCNQPSCSHPVFTRSSALNTYSIRTCTCATAGGGGGGAVSDLRPHLPHVPACRGGGGT